MIIYYCVQVSLNEGECLVAPIHEVEDAGTEIHGICPVNRMLSVA
jgi:hypothetical protein